MYILVVLFRLGQEGRIGDPEFDGGCYFADNDLPLHGDCAYTLYVPSTLWPASWHRSADKQVSFNLINTNEASHELGRLNRARVGCPRRSGRPDRQTDYPHANEPFAYEPQLPAGHIYGIFFIRGHCFLYP